MPPSLYHKAEFSPLDELSPKEVILHTFSPPPKRANYFLSICFSVSVVVSLIGLLGVWQKLLPKSNVYSVSSSSFARTFGFASLAVAEILLFIYWTSLSIFQFGAYAAGVAIMCGIAAKSL